MAKNPPVQWDDEDSDFDFETSETKQKETNEFASMLGGESEEDEEIYFKAGEKVTGVVTTIGEVDVLVDFGSKQVGIIAKDEVTEEGEVKVSVGDQLEAIVIEIRGTEIVLSKKMKASLRSKEGLEMAYQNKIPVQGRVTGKNKGGFEISLAGAKAFCPISKMDTKFVEDQSGYMNKSFEFLIEKMSGRDVVVSRAAALQLAGEAVRLEVLKKYEDDEDTIFQGTVTSTKEFGAFVDLGGLEGLVHISELSRSRVRNVSEVVNIGDAVQVKIKEIKTEGNRERISLSMKACSQDPWTTISERFQEEQSYPGKVVRIMEFGCFVELAPGIDGFAHISELAWGKRVRHPKDVVKEDQMVEARIISIDHGNQKMSLSLKSLAADPWNEAQEKLTEGATIFAKVDSLKPFGALMEVVPGVTGLLPISSIKRAFGEQYRKQMQSGLEVEVKVLSRDDAQRKVLLALPNVEEDSDDRGAFDEYLKIKKEQEKVQVTEKARGSFGDILAAKLKKS